MACDVLLAGNTTTISTNDPFSCLPASAVLSAHDLGMSQDGTGQQCNGKHNGLHFKFSLEGD
jgi:hypothetical protein